VLGKMKIHNLLLAIVSISFLFFCILFGFCPKRVFVREGLKIDPRSIKIGEQVKFHITVKRPGRDLSIKTVELLSPLKKTIYFDDTTKPIGSEPAEGELKEEIGKYEFTYDSKSIPLAIGDQFKPGSNRVQIEVGYYYARRDDKGDFRWDYEKSRFESSFHIRRK